MFTFEPVLSEFTSVTLYFCPLSPAELDADTVALIKSWLPQDEIDKVNRYIKQEAKEQGLMVRGFLRALLSKQAGLGPDEWRFEYGEKGKPRLSESQFLQTGLHFNLSHSGDWLVVGICEPQFAYGSGNTDVGAHKLELGVDIERCRDGTNIHSILSHYFSEPEKAALLALPHELQRARFFDLWALKESYIKAKGLGLALSLKSFAFDFSSLTETSLELDVGQNLNHTETSKGRLDTQQIICKQNIGLSLQEGSDDKQAVNHLQSQPMQPAKDWHCWLGHLDDSYRFAVSIGKCQQASIKAKVVNLPSLLASL